MMYCEVGLKNYKELEGTEDERREPKTNFRFLEEEEI